MAIKYKLDILTELKKRGYTSYRIRKEKILGESYLTQIRKGEIVSYTVLDKLCELLECDIGDIIEYIPEDKKKEK